MLTRGHKLCTTPVVPQSPVARVQVSIQDQHHSPPIVSLQRHLIPKYQSFDRHCDLEVLLPSIKNRKAKSPKIRGKLRSMLRAARPDTMCRGTHECTELLKVRAWPVTCLCETAKVCCHGRQSRCTCFATLKIKLFGEFGGRQDHPREYRGNSFSTHLTATSPCCFLEIALSCSSSTVESL